MMRDVQIFSAGCACCDAAVAAVKQVACANCNVRVRDMKDPEVAAEAARYGVKRVPAVVVDGKLADCCAAGGVDLDTLRSMGLGSA